MLASYQNIIYDIVYNASKKSRVKGLLNPKFSLIFTVFAIKAFYRLQSILDFQSNVNKTSLTTGINIEINTNKALLALLQLGGQSYKAI